MQKNTVVKKVPLVGAEEYSAYYSVTTDGRVISERRGIALSPSKVSQTREYQAVLLCANGRRKLFYVHRLVAQAFLPNPEKLPCVRHLDGNYTNNDVSNLAWCSYSEIATDSKRKSPWEVAPHSAVVSTAPTHKEFYQLLAPTLPYKVEAYLKARTEGMSYQAIADQFGVTRQAVYQALRRAFIHHTTANNR